MVNQFFSSTWLFGSLAWQTTIWLALGLLASIIWSGRPARAHRLLLLAIAAATITPLLSLAVRQMDWGLLPHGSIQHAREFPPRQDVLSAEGATIDVALDRTATYGRAEPPTVGPTERAIAVAADVPNDPASWGPLSPVSRNVLLLIGWAMLSTMVGLRLLVSLISARRILAEADVIHDGPLQQTLGEAAAALGLRGGAILRASPAVCLPIVWSWGQRPLVVVPLSESVQSSDVDWLGIFCHELAHWKRGDHLSGLVGELLLVALPWHPLAWWAKRRLIQLGEQACDDWVLTGKRSQADYAASLLNLRLQDRPVLAPAVISSRRGLARRVKRILAPRRSSPHVGRYWSIGAATLTVVCTVGAAMAQTRRGDIGVDQERPEAPRAETDGPTMVVTGRVVDSEGHPMSHAQVAVVARSRRPTRGGDLSAGHTKTLGLTRSDAQGAYHLTIPRTSSATFWAAHVLAVADGAGIAFSPIELDAERPDVEIRLAAEQPVRGRLIDSNGRPVSGAAVHVVQIGKSVRGEWQGAHFLEPPSDLPPWPKPTMSDEHGRFVIGGVNRDQGVWVQVRDDRFARQRLAMEPASKDPAAEIELELAPSQILQGRIVYADTQRAVAHARLTIYAGESEFEGRIGIDGRADPSGQFRLIPYPGKFLVVTAYPEEGKPYLSLHKIISWPEGAAQQKLEIALPRGVLIEGKVTEAESGQPVAWAAVQYLAGSATGRNLPEGIVSGWQAVVLTGPDGVFKIAVPRGSGHLLVLGPTPDYILQEMGSRELFQGQPGGRRNYAHAFVPLDTEADTGRTPLSVTVRRGVTVKGRLVGPGGEPVSEALILRRFQTSLSLPQWRGLPLKILGDRFQLDGLDPQATYRVLFLDSEHEWGAVAEVSGRQAGDQPVTVQLKPCGSAVTRFVNPDGKPLLGDLRFKVPSLMVVVTPGVSTFDWGQGRRQGELVANEGHVANFDRRHHWDGPIADEQGRCTFAALIPGATYKFYFRDEKDDIRALSFTVAPGQTKRLPDIVVREHQ